MIRKATLNDAQAIYDLISQWAKKAALLNRSLNSIYESIRDFWVYQENEKIVACVALHSVGWQDLGEIRSLAVLENFQEKGIGKILVEKCLEEAVSLEIKAIFALTFVPDFFIKLGFRTIERSQLPHKIWSDCVECIYFPNCKEEAVIYNL